MPSPSSPPSKKPLSLMERAERLREKMIASALLDLEDWSPVRPRVPELAEGEVAAVFDPPPVRWAASDPALEAANEGGPQLAG